VICDTCRRYIECGDPAIAARIEEMCKANGFSKRGYLLAVFGTCAECGR